MSDHSIKAFQAEKQTNLNPYGLSNLFGKNSFFGTNSGKELSLQPTSTSQFAWRKTRGKGALWDDASKSTRWLGAEKLPPTCNGGALPRLDLLLGRMHWFCHRNAADFWLYQAIMEFETRASLKPWLVVMSKSGKVRGRYFAMKISSTSYLETPRPAVYNSVTSWARLPSYVIQSSRSLEGQPA